MKIHWLAAVALLAWGATSPKTAHADVFKCRDAHGGITFSDMPCADGTKDESAPALNSTPKSLGVDCWYKKDTAACEKLKIISDGKPDVLAQAREDYKYAQDRDSCLAGDSQACMRSICRNAFSEKKTPEDILACSREQRLPNGSNWAMVLPWKDTPNGYRKGQAFCLTPITENYNGHQKLSFESIELRDDPRTVNNRYYRRYSASNHSGSTLEEAASFVCRH